LRKHLIIENHCCICLALRKSKLQQKAWKSLFQYNEIGKQEFLRILVYTVILYSDKRHVVS